MTLEPMTDEERDFAEQHHDMVYKFLHARRLPADEYYDVVIFGYLEAVQRNFRVAVDPERRNFSALANICMKTAVCREIRFRWKDRRKANNMTMSMECPLSDDESLSLHDIVPDETRNVMLEVENRDLIRRALSVASERECKVLAYLYSGFSMAEISQITGINIHTARAASSGLHQKPQNNSITKRTKTCTQNGTRFIKRRIKWSATRVNAFTAQSIRTKSTPVIAPDTPRKKPPSMASTSKTALPPPTRANQEGSCTASIPIPPLKSK